MNVDVGVPSKNVQMIKLPIFTFTFTTRKNQISKRDFYAVRAATM